MRRTSVLSDEGVAGVHPRNQTINAGGAELMGTLLGRGWGRHVFLQEDGRQRGVPIHIRDQGIIRRYESRNNDAFVPERTSLGYP